jgi:hypothetical protein
MIGSWGNAIGIYGSYASQRIRGRGVGIFLRSRARMDLASCTFFLCLRSAEGICFWRGEVDLGSGEGEGEGRKGSRGTDELGYPGRLIFGQPIPRSFQQCTGRFVRSGTRHLYGCEMS